MGDLGWIKGRGVDDIGWIKGRAGLRRGVGGLGVD